VDYWNHNSAYHPMIVSIAKRMDGDVLDVGCGEGLLVERLAEVSQSVVGIDPDDRAIKQAVARTKTLANVEVQRVGLMDLQAERDSYDLIIFGAALHHLELEGALQRSAQLLRPGGRVVAIGLSADQSIADHLWSAVLFLPVRLMSWLHHENRTVQVATRPPQESLHEIVTTARRTLPGVRVRRAFYYRYVLAWEKPPH
jgi:2-polyprenyl-3-methyl-5-hydroxy-6-metoxy-1,4-benzoquinol methylase